MITSFPAFAAALDRRLRPGAAAPLAVGFSGGGDSLALLTLTLDWARMHDRPVVSLTVDHQLNPASPAWTAEAVAKAQARGARAQALAWTGPKPVSGLSAAARAARHALLARAAREAGARVLLLGHTADDLAEAALMRAEGSTVSDPREWAPSPAWPEGRDLFVLRPLLAVGRGEIRAWLRGRGETWLDDPANEDPRSARARARLSSPVERSGTEEEAAKATEGASSRPTPAPNTPSVTSPVGAAPAPPFHGGEGCLTLLRTAPAAHVAAACLCAAGTTRPPRGERLRRLVNRIQAGEAFTATLAGARIEAAGEGVSFFREPGEPRRAPGPPLADPSDRLPHRGAALETPLSPNQPVVWDGRYELTAVETGLIVRALQGLAARLPAAQRQALKGLPAAARPGLPAVLAPDGTVICPILAEPNGVRARCLVVDRFRAAIGLVDQEPAT